MQKYSTAALENYTPEYNGRPAHRRVITLPLCLAGTICTARRPPAKERSVGGGAVLFRATLDSSLFPTGSKQ